MVEHFMYYLLILVGEWVDRDWLSHAFISRSHPRFLNSRKIIRDGLWRWPSQMVGYPLAICEHRFIGAHQNLRSDYDIRNFTTCNNKSAKLVVDYVLILFFTRSYITNLLEGIFSQSQASYPGLEEETDF